MTRTTVAGLAIAGVLTLLAVTLGLRYLDRGADPASTAKFPVEPEATITHPASESGDGFLYGRVTTTEGAIHEGRLRWGRGEEAFWGDYCNGTKRDNPWVGHVPPERLREGRPVEILGVEVARREHRVDVDRPFMARFGDIARIDARLDVVRVTLKSGTVFELDRFAAGDIDDGVRVGGDDVVEIGSRQIRTIEFLPAPSPGKAPYRLHGTVRTRQGEFAGFVQWNREKCVGSDELVGRTEEGEIGVRFDTIRSIERRWTGGLRVTLLDGREVVFSETREVGGGNRGTYVDDPRYGRVLISRDAFERVDFDAGGSGPAYGDFPPGLPLTGSVTTRGGKLFAGRLVFDLDESETTETLDAPSRGVDYTIPFGLIAAIVPGDDGESARVTLLDGEELRLERTGDLGDGNAGMLIFLDGGPGTEYVPWTDIARIEFNRPRIPKSGGYSAG